MSQREKVREVLYAAIDQINDTLPRDKQIVKAEGTLLLKERGGLDSLELTLLIVAIEQKIEEAFGRGIVLNAMGPTALSHPLRSVGVLTDYISSFLISSPQLT